MDITAAEARRFLIAHQGLSGAPFRGKPGILHCLERVGSIQYDPLDVVGRNADLVLAARIPGYRRTMLSDLLYKDRLIMDGWDKMMSIYPISDWPAMARVRAARERQMQNVLKWRGTDKALEYLELVKNFIQENGPVASNQLKVGSAPEHRGGPRDLAGAAMDYLFHTGELGVFTKKSGQKVYDRMEHLLPPELFAAPDPFPDEDAFLRWYVKRRVGSVGLLRNKNTGGWLGEFLEIRAVRDRVLAELVDLGEVVTVNIEGFREPFYMQAESLPLMESRPQPSKKAIFLGPLDNLLWDRDMVARLFHFDYTWEVYVPAAKRKYGYYVLPVLYRDKLVARFEPDHHRGSDPLRIKNWWWEPNVRLTPALCRAVEEAFERFAAYLGASGIEGAPSGLPPR